MRKKIIIFLLIFITISLLGVTIFNKKSVRTNPKNDIITKIEKKETFNVLLTNGNNEELVNLFKYYEKAYSLKYSHMKYIYTSSEFNNIMSKLPIKITPDINNAFLMIEQGSLKYSLLGDFNEEDLKKLLINAHIIDQEYEDIDKLINNDFKNNYDENKIYSILYLNKNDENLYKYREILVKNKVKTLVMYTNGLNQADIEESLKNQINYGEDITKKLPIIMKVRNNKVMFSTTNITLDNLLEKFK